VTWLDGHGVSVAGLWAEHFNVPRLLRATQHIDGRINTTLSFWLIALDTSSDYSYTRRTHQRREAEQCRRQQ